jgi:hypothetical protein
VFYLLKNENATLPYAALSLSAKSPGRPKIVWSRQTRYGSGGMVVVVQSGDGGSAIEVRLLVFLHL